MTALVRQLSRIKRLKFNGWGGTLLNTKLTAPLILVVEDSVLVAMAIEDALQMRGYDVIVASTLSAAQRLIEQRVPAAALLDLQLPDGLSLDLAQRLHQMGCAVAMSSGFERDAIPESHEFVVQFRKPVSPEILAEWADQVTVI